VGNFGNVLFGLHAGNMKFDTQNEEWISIIICITSSVYFSIHHM
jgi:hypothetical protein